MDGASKSTPACSFAANDSAPPTALLGALRGLAESAARAAGGSAQRAFAGPLSISFKSDGSEVTDADIEAERAALEVIRRSRPHDRFITEENTAGAASSGSAGKTAPCADDSGFGPLWWVIDPIDGTRNFVRGIHAFTSSVAVLAGGVPVAGALHDPARDALYSAAAGCGAWLNGERLPLAPRRPAADKAQKLLVGVPSTLADVERLGFRAALEDCVIRNFGSSALHLALVAAGQLDAALLSTCRIWDIAAGWLLVREAGGEMTAADGGPLFPLDPQHYHGAEMPSLAGRAGVHSRLNRMPHHPRNSEP